MRYNNTQPLNMENTDTHIHNAENTCIRVNGATRHKKRHTTNAIFGKKCLFSYARFQSI